MRKISFFGGVAVLVLIGVGAWIAVGTSSSTSALAASTIDPFAMMASAKGCLLRTTLTTRWSSIELTATTQKPRATCLGICCISPGSFATLAAISPCR